jgi:hypothetical protein
MQMVKGLDHYEVETGIGITSIQDRAALDCAVGVSLSIEFTLLVGDVLCRNDCTAAEKIGGILSAAAHGVEHFEVAKLKVTNTLVVQPRPIRNCKFIVVILIVNSGDRVVIFSLLAFDGVT